MPAPKPRPLATVVLACLALLAAAALGCAAGQPKGPVFEPLAPPDGRSTLVYVYRLDSAKSAFEARVKLDGEEIANMANGEYLAVVVDPGLHEVAAALKWLGLLARSWNDMKIETRGGQTVYLKLFAAVAELPRAPADANVPGRSDEKADVGLMMSLVDRATAERELATTRHTHFR